jgi:putative ABC transport system substrate-binding protein
MRRRDFITLLGGTAAWPVVARAQQPIPVVGYLRNGSRAVVPHLEAAFRGGLGSMGFAEGRNIAIDYRYLEGEYDRLPAFAADLVRRQVAVIYVGDNATALAAKAATTSIPIIFRIGGDPVQLGLVTSLSRLAGNLTGVSFLATATEAIRLQMLHDAVPNAKVVGFLVNPTNANAEPDTREAQKAARELGLDLQVVSAGGNTELDAAFATLVQRRAQALAIEGDAFFTSRRQQIAALMMRHAMPAISNTRDFPDAGGLMSYGASSMDADRLGGVYVGRVLKGERIGDLPVQQSVKVELTINLTIARVLGLDIPPALLARADEVIE